MPKKFEATLSAWSDSVPRELVKVLAVSGAGKYCDTFVGTGGTVSAIHVKRLVGWPTADGLTSNDGDAASTCPTLTPAPFKFVVVLRKTVRPIWSRNCARAGKVSETI